MIYSVEKSAILVSVRELCARALFSGDLDSGRGGFDAMANGREVHKLLQERAVGGEAEVFLCGQTELHGISFEVQGRADLVFHTDPLTVEEIKTVTSLASGKKPTKFHEAQAMCYAFLLAKRDGLEEVRIRLTLALPNDGGSRSVDRVVKKGELEAYFTAMLSFLLGRAEILRDRALVRLPSVQTGRFPYPTVRESQDRMLRECYRAMKNGKRLFVSAPTGIGKTVSALYPAVRAVGEGLCDRVFYLTAKTSTGREAFRAASDIFKAGSHLRTVVLSSRDSLCPNETACADPGGISAHCNGHDCPRAKGYYDRVESAICDLLGRASGFPRSAILETAEKFGICPYEFQLDLSELCDILICDYNYAFDPMVYLRRYFEPDAVAGAKNLFLVDEAHNLADRACAMYSAEIKKSDLEPLRVIFSSFEGGKIASEALDGLCGNLTELRKRCRDNLSKDGEGILHGFDVRNDAMVAFTKQVSETREAIELWRSVNPASAIDAECRVLTSLLKRFEVVGQWYDEKFLTFLEVNGKDVSLRMICLDPSGVLHEKLKNAYASVFFSATLMPTDYYADILGGGKDAVLADLPSPFDADRLLVTAVTGISTRFEDREKSYKKIASVIAATASGKAGNYIAFFPSFAYLEKVFEVFVKKYPDVTVVLQEKGMTAAGKEQFLSQFREDGKLRIGFCVLGGSFSEGVDLPGNRLIGVCVVGVGLPGISSERNILRDYYETTRERGYDYAYTYPGMNRVLQAAGRVIRREDDRGIVILVDDRYAEPRYKALLPKAWNSVQYASNASELANITQNFWMNCKK